MFCYEKNIDANFTQVDYSFSITPINIPARIFVSIEQIFPRCRWKDKESIIAKPF